VSNFRLSYVIKICWALNNAIFAIKIANFLSAGFNFNSVLLIGGHFIDSSFTSSLWISKTEKFKVSHSPFPSHPKNPPFTHLSLRRKKIRKIVHPSLIVASERKKFRKGQKPSLTLLALIFP